MRMAFVLVGALLTTTGCAVLDRSADDDLEFRTTFTSIAPEGFIDMSLDVDNPLDEPVALDGRLVARDDKGRELDDVTVTSAYGIEDGRLALMPSGDVDFVQLDGPSENLVSDVTLEDVEWTPLGTAVAEEPVKLTSLDRRGRELDYDDRATAVRLDNPNEVDVRIRVVLLVLGTPEAGVPQEAIQVHDVATVDVPAASGRDLPLDEETRAILRRQGLLSFVSLRPVFAPPG